MEVEKIIILFCKLLKTQEISDYVIKVTINALLNTGISLKIIIKNIANKLNEKDDYLAERILMIVDNMAEPGTYWDTFRDLLIRKHPSTLSLQKIVRECVYNNMDKSHIRDVYMNYLRRLKVDQLSSLNLYLKEQLNSLIAEYGLINEADNLIDSQSISNVNTDMNLSNNDRKQQCEIPAILSPDCNQQFEQISQFPHKDIQVSQTSSSRGSFAIRSFKENNNSSPPNKASIHNFFNQRRDTLSHVGSLVKHDSPDLNVRTSKTDGENTYSCTSYKLHRLGKYFFFLFFFFYTNKFHRI